MNQMQQLLMQANKMQRELQKAHEALSEKEFTASNAGMVEVTMKGDKTLVKVDIDADALEKDNKDMLEQAIVNAINEAVKKIVAEAEKIDEDITGRKGGLPF